MCIWRSSWCSSKNKDRKHWKSTPLPAMSSGEEGSITTQGSSCLSLGYHKASIQQPQGFASKLYIRFFIRIKAHNLNASAQKQDKTWAIPPWSLNDLFLWQMRQCRALSGGISCLILPMKTWRGFVRLTARLKGNAIGWCCCWEMLNTWECTHRACWDCKISWWHSKTITYYKSKPA